MKSYNPPELTEYGTVTDITEADGGLGKVGDGEDEFSESTGLTGSVGFPQE